MVTGASGPVGHALVPLLARRDEVRAAVRDPASAEPLRALGAKVTLDRLDDSGALAEVLAGVFTLVHLVGGPDQPDDDALWDANHGSVLRSIKAARSSGVRRIVFVSVPGASPEHPLPFLRAKGLAEEAVATSGLQHAVIRSSPVVGGGSLWFAATVAGALESPPIVWGPPDRSLAPVAVGDLAAVLAVADDLDSDLSGTWALEGPDAVCRRPALRDVDRALGRSRASRRRAGRCPVSRSCSTGRCRLTSSMRSPAPPELTPQTLPMRSGSSGRHWPRRCVRPWPLRRRARPTTGSIAATWPDT